MLRSAFDAHFSVTRWLRTLVSKKETRLRRRKEMRRSRAFLDFLEERVLLSTLVQAGSIVSIHLDTNNEVLQITSNGAGNYALSTSGTFTDGGISPSAFSGFGGSSGNLVLSGVTQVNIDDNAGARSGGHIIFNDSGGNPYAEIINVSLTNNSAGIIEFNGDSTFSGNLTVSTTNNVAINAGATVTLNGASSVLQATGTNATVSLNGSLEVTSATLQVNAGRTISQGAGAVIETASTTAATFSLTGALGDILLGNIFNDLAGSVTFAQSGTGTVRDVSLRNMDPAAQIPTITGLSIRNYTLFFDNTSIALPAGLSVTNNLNVSAGSGITEGGAVTAGGSGTFTVLTNGSILLNTAAGNNFTGAVSFNAVSADNTTAVAFTGAGAVSLGFSSLGLGTFTVTALNGNITQTAAVTQKRGAGAATFTVAGSGTTVTLNNASNDFEGPVTLSGPVTTATLDNTSTLAAVPTIPASVTALTLTFANAPALLPSLNLTNLTVNAQGIVQASGSAVVVSGNADLQANSNPLVLAGAANDFTNIRLRNSGPNIVAINDVNSINFAVGNSSIGSGTFTVNAGGAITQSSNTITQALNAGRTVFFAGPGSAITLGQNNNFRGPLSFSTSGVAGNVNLTSSGINVLLGTAIIGGNLLISNASVSQDPGSTLNVAGTTTIGVGGAASTLDNEGNNLLGSVGVSGSSVTIRNTGALDFLASNVTGSLTVHAGGAITQSGAITGASTALFDAGAAGVTLSNAGNDFGTVSVTSTGSAAVSITDSNALAVGRLNLGSGALNLTATNLSQLAGAGGITQTAATNLTLGVTGSVSLQATANDFLGAISLPTGAAGCTLVNQGDISFVGTPTLSGTIRLTAGGVLTLPNSALNVTSLTASANLTHVSGNITTTGGGTPISFTGTVALASGITLNTSASSAAQVDFGGDVNPAGPLTITLGSNGAVNLNGGIWTQGTSSLTVNGGATFNIGDGTNLAVFSMQSGTFTLSNNDTLNILSGATFKVGGTSAAETVTVDNGSGDVVFQAGSTLSVGLGATNDKLAKLAGNSGDILINAGARLTSYAGLAGNAASPVLDAASGVIDTSGGFFDLTVDPSNNNAPHVFLMGTDIVQTNNYDGAAQLTVVSGGTVSASGTVTGFEPDSDMYTVKASTGAAAQLVAALDVQGHLDIVVRNAAAATTLTVTTTLSFGDGLTDIGGIAINGPGAATILAPTSNVHDDILVAGPLTALTVRDFTGNAVGTTVIRAGGNSTQATAIIGRAFTDVSIDLPTVLTSLSVNNLDDSGNAINFISAERYGVIKSTPLPASNLPGDFQVPRLWNINAASSSVAAIGAVTVGGTLGDLGVSNSRWDINGNVTLVSAANTANWRLGRANGANVRNGDELMNVSALSLGVAGNTNLHAVGKVTAVTATSWANGALQAASFGALKTTGNATLGDFGNFDGVTLVATGNSGNVALASLSVAGNSSNVTIDLLNGNATLLSVARQATNWNLTANVTTAGGTVTALTAGAFSGLTLDAKTAGAISAVGNAVAGLFGDIAGSSITLQATPGFTGVALGVLKAARNLDGGSSILVDDGSITAITVGRSINNTDIRALGAAGSIGLLTAAEWIAGGGSDNLVARNIVKMAITGAPLTAPNSGFLPGDFTQVNVLAFSNSGVLPAIAALTVAGNYNFANNGFLRADNGITLMSVGRQVLGAGSSQVSLQKSSSASDIPGRIAALTVGKWNAVNIAARTLGAVKVTGFVTPENPTPALTTGNFTNSSVSLFGATLTTKVSFDSLSANLISGSKFIAPFGITSVTASNVISNTTISTDNPTSATTGRIGTLQAGGLTSDIIRAVSVGVLKTAANISAGLLGDVTSTDLTVTGFTGTALAPIGVGAVAVAGRINLSTVNVPASITALAVAGGMGAGGGDQIAAGFAANSGITALSSANVIQSSLTTRRITTFAVPGNANFAIRGDVTGSLITLTGNLSGVALGTFTATGKVSGSTINVTGGNVTSFTTGAFLSSRLMVGFHMPSPGDITAAASSGNWLTGSTFTLGTFKTTGIFDQTNVPFTASFRDSFVVAQKLGSVTIRGLDNAVPAGSTSVDFGVAFRTSAGAGPSISVNGVNHAAPFTVNDFDYLGLLG